MKNFLGVLMIVLGVCLGIYVGFWVCLVGGIVDIVHSFDSGSVGGVIWGAVKFVFAGISGYASAALLIIPGASLIGE